jgi:hypothetical protein
MQNPDSTAGVSRREFVTTAGGAAVGAVLAGSGVRVGAQQKRRHAIVGTGVRGVGM